MSTRLHAMGFASEWTPQMLRHIEVLSASRSKLVGAAKGNYRVWRSKDGAELWFHYPHRTLRDRLTTKVGPVVPEPLRPIAVTPFHRGLSSVPIRIGRYLSADRLNPLEGSCMAWLPPPGVGGRRQAMVLELAPYGLQALRTPPHDATAQIVCFSHRVWSFADAAGYIRQTPGNRRIQNGSISPITATDVPEVELTYGQSPITLGLMTGTVRRAIRYVNPETHDPYYWFLLETRRGAIDVIANPAHVEGDISEGHVAQVCGSFLARLAGAGV